ncbi:hypothetical protein NYR55_13315 [Sphingomonas sp. BGYR3]|uniref:hypothetical protein n=1 Tax=Sphingomonas sp. BGYR3 TaxID=2975483 RepID=UPI0021A428E4|nr:hypothetical protein [Sphingomonas sp. BGYR3]MDG5489597.1 hypothetical protein [Sphingomonas sp. BGYR3]
MTAVSPVPLDQLLASPDHHGHAIDGSDMLFARMSRTHYAESIFLDQRIVRAAQDNVRVPLSALGQMASASPLPATWIFHMAHCGSTLLARALDRPDGPLVLREPVPLRQIAAALAQRPADPRPLAALYRIAAALASRRYRPDWPTIIKANVPVNFAIDPLLDSAGSQAVFLYFPLEPYLAAVLRSDGHRQWVGRITEELKPAIEASAGPLGGLDPVGRAAILWLAQTRRFIAAMDRYPASWSLDAGSLTAQPGATLDALADRLGLDWMAGQGRAIAEGPLFSTYSKKDGVRFDDAMRRAREAAVLDQLGDAIPRARALIAERTAGNPLPDAMPRPVHGGAAPLMARGR